MPPLCEITLTEPLGNSSISKALLGDKGMSSVTLTIPIVFGPRIRIAPAAAISSSCFFNPSGPCSAKPLVRTIAAGVPSAANSLTALKALSVPTMMIATSGVSGKVRISG